MHRLRVKRRKIANVFAGEPWIYPNAIVECDVAAGLCHVETEDGDHVGYADYNAAAPIRGRLLSREDVWPGDEVFIQDMLVRAIERRMRLGYHFQGSGMRVVNGEGDGLSGLVIDCFATTMVVDVYSHGMRERLDLIRAFFYEKLPDMRVLTRMGPDAAKREGVDTIDPDPLEVTFCEHAVRYSLNLGGGQKTGFYLDQRDNRRLVAQWGRSRKVLDLFAYHGAFSLAALANGASSALAVDSSAPALDIANRNAQTNGLELELLCGDVFDLLDDLVTAGPYDLIICDPPKLAPRKSDYQKALKAYRFLVDRSLKALAPGGLLLVASCSSAIGHEDLRKLLLQQAKHKYQLDVVAATGHPADHPWPVAFTTGRYLSALMVEKRP